jgi:hypothetical protein
VPTLCRVLPTDPMTRSRVVPTDPVLGRCPTPPHRPLCLAPRTWMSATPREELDERHRRACGVALMQFLAP